jgi:predicted nucleic-acid-binding protein
MSALRLADTNLIVRHLTQDNPKQAQIAGKVFAACDRGDLVLVILSAVLAECVFVLESFYRLPREQIGRTLGLLVSSPGIELADAEIHLDALRRYRHGKIHFIDCIVAAHAAVQKIPVATFDSDFKKFPDVVVALD